MSGAGRPKPLHLVQAVAGVAVVVAVVLVMRRVDIIPKDHGGPLFALGFLIVAGTVGGKLAAAVGLPRLTGNLVAGILAGPEGVGLLDERDVKALSLMNALALALIALEAGAEITLPTLKRVWKGVAASALAQVVIVIPLVGGTFFLVHKYIPFAKDFTTAGALGLGLVVGSISFCRSPSVTLAVIAETKAKGPLSDWTLGVVVLLDVILLPIFAANLSIARTQILGLEFEADALVTLGRDLFASLAAGVTFGLVVAGVFKLTKERILVVVVLAYFLTWMCDYLHYDTLFCFVIAGFVVTNLTTLGHDIIETSDKMSAGVMVVFFSSAGAKLEVSALKALWPFALLFVVARAAATFLAVQVGHKIAKDPPAVRQNSWLGLVSQAGVTIGLAVVASDALPGTGRPFASLCIAIVAINELVGAVLMKFGLERAKETATARAAMATAATSAAAPPSPA